MNTRIDAWETCRHHRSEPQNTENSVSNTSADGDAKRSLTSRLFQLPNLLRGAGALALVVGMYSFMFQGWQVGNDISRYLILLAHTGTLVLIGLASSSWLKENNGPRLLLSLALASVPANFAILGAFFYSQSGSVFADYPSFATWGVENLSDAFMTTAGALVVLIPVCLFSFSVLLRGLSKRLTLLFLLSNVALLVPVRDPQLLAPMALILALLAIFASYKISRDHTAARTTEGITALSLQLLPVAVLVGRNLWLYAGETLMLSVVAFVVFIILRQLSLYLQNHARLQSIINVASVLPALAIVPLLSAALWESNLLINDVIMPIASLVAAVMIYTISYHTKYAALYRRVAVTTALLGVAANVFFFDGLTAAIIGIVIGIAITAYGVKQKQRSLLIGGLTIILISIGQQAYQLVYQFDLNNWAAMAGLGLVAIISASMMESSVLKPRLASIKKEYKNWQE